jgi:GT2 family glycosyltransferase
VIVENNSTEDETFAYYKELEASNPKAHVVYWDGIFNYSAINNFGASHAKGEYLLLLNNDTEIISPDCLEQLLGYCMRPDVGAVGARLYYEDDTVQHAGVVIGFGGIAGHCFVQQKRDATGYCHRIICAQDYSAVTAACMMVKREAFDKVHGLSEEFQVAFNDIDFCLRLGKAGYLVVYNPYAELYHYESKSRGLEDTPEKVARFNREIASFEKHWPEILRDGDPYYNPNLTLESQDFSLKRI